MWQSAEGPSAVSIIVDYHQRTRHDYNAYAKGPETLDWDAQPSPFRQWTGAPRTRLPLLAQLQDDTSLGQRLQQPFNRIFTAFDPLPLSRESLAAWLEMSLGITAWKALGPDRWAVRANPSSGNLHPVEAYLVIHAMPGFENGLYHYCSEDHSLAMRARHFVASEEPALAIALTSIMWRETWKYGERAFRYCQLDTGHAMAALAHAACALGWTLHTNASIGQENIARLCGVDRYEEFPARRQAETEREEPEILMQLQLTQATFSPLSAAQTTAFAEHAEWYGVATRIDPYPMYRWPLIEEAALASRSPDRPLCADTGKPLTPYVIKGGQTSISQVILGRRSAQRFDVSWYLPHDDFMAMLDALIKVDSMPLPAPGFQPAVGAYLMILRVENLAPGLYWLPLNHAALASPPPVLRSYLQGETVNNETCGVHGSRLMMLKAIDRHRLQQISRQVHCQQEIAGTCCFSLGIVSEFGGWLEQHAGHYRDLLRLAGAYGHRLYLLAEAMGVRGTGIGCYFDNAVHELFGLPDKTWQSLYHFTIGKPLEDNRIISMPAYAGKPDFLTD